ncbi:hypothetical protein U1Q18_049748 [Sarracenia purpurea var. burkii]
MGDQPSFQLARIRIRILSLTSFPVVTPQSTRWCFQEPSPDSVIRSGCSTKQHNQSNELIRARWPNEHDQRSQLRIQTSGATSTTRLGGKCLMTAA